MDQWITEQSILQKHIADAKKSYKQTSAFYVWSNKGKSCPHSTPLQSTQLGLYMWI
jgi:hypothetical protein